MKVKFISYLGDSAISHGELLDNFSSKISSATNAESNRFESASNHKDLLTKLQQGFKTSNAVVLAIDISSYISIKCLICKAMRFKCERNQQIISKINSDDCVAKLSQGQLDAQSAIPVGGKVFLTFDGLFSGFALKTSKQRLIVVPLDEPRLNNEYINKVIEYLKDGIEDYGEKNILLETAKKEAAADAATRTIPAVKPEAPVVPPVENITSTIKPDLTRRPFNPVRDDYEDISSSSLYDMDDVPEKVEESAVSEEVSETDDEFTDTIDVQLSKDGEEEDVIDEVSEENDVTVAVIPEEEQVESVGDTSEAESADEIFENDEDLTVAAAPENDDEILEDDDATIAITPETYEAESSEEDSEDVPETPVIDVENNIIAKTVDNFSSCGLYVAFAIPENGVALDSIFAESVDTHSSKFLRLVKVPPYDDASNETECKESVSEIARNAMMYAESSVGIAVSDVYTDDDSNDFIYVAMCDKKKTDVYKIFALEGEEAYDLTRTAVENAFNMLNEKVEVYKDKLAAAISGNQPVEKKKNYVAQIIVWVIIILVLCGVGGFLAFSYFRGEGNTVYEFINSIISKFTSN